MKKSAVILALAIGFSFSSLNAATSVNEVDPKKTTSVNEVNAKSTLVKKVKLDPLCKAVALGDVEKVKAYLGSGAKVNVKSNGMSPIHYAAKFNREYIVRILIAAGAKVDSKSDKGYTALNHAGKTNATDAMGFLKLFENK